MAVPEFKTQEEVLEDMMTDAESTVGISSFDVRRTGGVIHGILYIVSKAIAAAYSVLNDALSQAFITLAGGTYLDNLGNDYARPRAVGTKTRGKARFYRASSSGNKTIPLGTIVGTDEDANGNVLTFLVLADTILPDGETEVQVLVEAAQIGKRYNVGQLAITQILTPIAGIDGVLNDFSPQWITVFGTDAETDDTYRARLLGRWDAIAATKPTEGFAEWAFEVSGVGTVAVDDTNPRGAGTVDIIILGADGGLPSAQLIADVQALFDSRTGLTDDVLVLGPSTVAVDIDVTVSKHPTDGELAAVQADIEGALTALFTYDANYPGIAQLGIGDDVKLARIKQVVMSRPYVVDVTVTTPAANVVIQFTEMSTLNSLNVVMQTADET